MNQLPILDQAIVKNNESFISELLSEQQELSAVETFSKFHDSEGRVNAPANYTELMPVTKPKAGEQYAFEVDLDRCSGCKACVVACHSLNGLDEKETWRDVGLLIGGTVDRPMMQHVTTACHHCVEPACMNACPVNAYEKDPETGIVKHLDDQCFGCQYCTLACPYDVPKFHAGKGIVRKCDMCSSRLKEGEPPACAQACPHEAISIKIVSQEEVVENAEADLFLPGAPNPQISFPTTHFKTAKVFPRNALPADYHSTNPQHPHWPLIVMLVLTQLSVGAFITSLVLMEKLSLAGLWDFQKTLTTTALAIGLLALGASTLHLGRPLYAFRAFLGIRHSWLSREIIVFGAFAGAAVLFAAANWFGLSYQLRQLLGWSVAVTGVGGIFCSVMIYAVTRREYWSFGRTTARFLLSGAVTGVAATWLAILCYGVFVGGEDAFVVSQMIGPDLVRTLILFATLKIGFELWQLRHLFERNNSVFKRSAKLLTGELSPSMFARVAFGVLGGVIMPLFVLQELGSATGHSLQIMVAVSMMFLACLLGEVLERYHFFAACVSPRMPGPVK